MNSDQPRAIYLILLLVLVLSSFIVTSRGRGPEVWRAARWWVLIFGAGILGAAFWPDIQPRLMGVFDPGGGQVSGKDIVFRKQDDGHFYARAEVNGTPIMFAIDTGASTIALTRDDARKIGFDPASLSYNRLSMTANGTAKMAGVKLRSIKIGGREFENVAADVLDSDLDISLMGMSFLSKFGKLIMEGDRLTLSSGR
jgi:aspartyl protease family protein